MGRGGLTPLNYANPVLRIIWHRLCDILSKLELITANALNFHNRHDLFFAKQQNSSFFI